MKRCPKCGKTKPKAEFHKSSRSKDGLQSWCRSCGTAAATRWNAEHCERHRYNVVKWKAEHPEQSRANGAAQKLSNRNKALILLGDHCPKCGAQLAAKPSCDQEIAFGAHHIIPRAISGRPRINWGWKWLRVKAELSDGCELLCVPCHRAAEEHLGSINYQKN
jgi:hypothetical protein